MTALMHASGNGQIDIVNILLAIHGINVNMKDKVKKQLIVDWWYWHWYFILFDIIMIMMMLFDFVADDIGW